MNGKGQDGVYRLHGFSKLLGGQRLLPVAQGMGGVVVDLDHQSVGTGSSGGDGHGFYHRCVTGGMAGVHHDGQMGHLAQRGDGGQVKGVAGRGLKGADAPFTEDDLLISAGHDVFGAHQKLLQSRRKSAL